jgi:hypothetical protein
VKNASALLIVLLLAAGWARTARGDVCGQGLVVRVNPAGLDFVAAQVRARVPEQVPFPDRDHALFAWPLGDEVVIELRDVVVDLELDELALAIDGDALRVRLAGAMVSQTPLTVRNAYGVLGDAHCQADVQLRGIELEIAASIRSEGGLEVSIADVQLDIAHEPTVIEFDDCLAGDIATFVIDFVRKRYREQILAFLEELGKEQLPSLIAAKLSERIEFSGELEQLAYTVRLDGVEAGGDGVELVLGAELSLAPDDDGACAETSQAQPPSCQGRRPPLKKSEAMFAAGISEPLINNTLHSVWRGGHLCLDAEELAERLPLIAPSLAKLAPALGLPESTEIALEIHIHAPPRLDLESDGMTLVLEQLLVELALHPDEGPAESVSLETAVAVTVRPTLDPKSGTIGFDLRRVAFERFFLPGREDSDLALDPARVERFIEVIVMPVLQQRMQQLQLSPSVIGVGDLLIELREFDIGQGFLAAHLDAHGIVEGGDDDPPETKVVTAPDELVGPQLVMIQVSGDDDQTPARLLRFSHRIDDGPWSDPTFSRRIDVATTSGEHRVEIVAIDLQDNEDDTPVELQFEVDADPPTLEIHERPDPLIHDGNATVSFSGGDSRTAEEDLAYRVQLLAVPHEGGNAKLVDEKPFEQDIERVTFHGIDDGGLYRLRVTVRDEAGNVTSADAGFAVDYKGCSTAPAGPDAPSLVLWGGLLLLWIAGRRSRRLRKADNR